MKCFWRFYRCLFTVIVVAHYGKHKEKKNQRGDLTKLWKKEPWVVTLDVEKRIRTNGKQEKKRELLEKNHLKLQVDTQTQFVLPAVPKLTKRGQPVANSCSAGEFVSEH